MGKNNHSSSIVSDIDVYEQIPRGKEYKPAITIQDVPSLGRSSRIYGLKTGRQHDFLSDNERNFYYYLLFSSEVIDIREQFPLQLDMTLLIAEELGLKHPIHPKTKEPIHMTSDFCATVNADGKMKDIICTIKNKDDLVERRVIEKFEIEQTYWRQLGIDWNLITDVDINKRVALNIADVMHYFNLEMLESFNKIDEEEMNDILIAFIQRLIDSSKSVREVSSVFERDLHLAKGAGISLFKHLIARKYITVNLFEQLNLDNIIRIDLTRETINLGEVVS